MWTRMARLPGCSGHASRMNARLEGAAMNRRLFLRNSAIGMGAMAKVGFTDLKADELNHPSTGLGADGVGRPVRVTSIGFKGGALPLEKMASLVDEEGAR